jgi:penicillin-binding protein 1C
MRRFRRLIFAGGGIALAAFALWCWWLPLPEELLKPTDVTLTLLDCHDRVIAEIGSAQARVQHPVPLEKMGRWLPQVTVALEDHRFYEHGAMDFHATLGALVRDVSSLRIVSGGSTITQQLVKMAAHRRGRNWFDKVREAVLAWKLERRWSKAQILEAYLNRSHYGNLRVGVEAAAEAYFSKPAGDLTLAESIFLAGLPQAPTRFNPWRFSGAANQKYERSLARLAQLGVIGAAQQTLLAQGAPTVQRNEPQRLAPHFVDALLAEKPHLAGRVRTTLDLDLQNTAEHLLRAHLQNLHRADIANSAMVVVENATGAVRAMVGSADYKTCEVNGALMPRSCGSTLKPFIYLAAIDRRILTAASILPDTPDAIRDEYGDYDPQNYNNRYLGPVRVREALACSLNVPAVVTLGRLGARQGFCDLQKWGFQFARGLDEYGAGFILGNAEIRLLDLAGAYAGLARGGIAMQPALLASAHYPVAAVASPEATEIITDILCDNDARRRTFGNRSPLALGQRVAAKTGTSSGFRDAWTVGFDRDHTVAVWAGNMDGRPMHEVLAVESAAPLWVAMMRHLLEKDRPLAPVVSGGKIVRSEICKLTGLLASADSDETAGEFFLKGTEPVEDSPASFQILSGKKRLVLPREFAAWCASPQNYLGATTAPDAALAITNPKPDAKFEITPSLPPTQQMIEFAASAGAGVNWFVNGKKIAAQADGRVLWQLQPGEWRVTAVAAGQSASASFIVARD